MLRKTHPLRYHVATYKKMPHPLEELIGKSFMLAVTGSDCDERKFTAFRYIAHYDRAPVCVAKGGELDYDDAVKIAQKKKINIIQHSGIANYLFNAVDLRGEIPIGLYQSFVYLYLGYDLHKVIESLGAAVLN